MESMIERLEALGCRVSIYETETCGQFADIRGLCGHMVYQGPTSRLEVFGNAYIEGFLTACKIVGKNWQDVVGTLPQWSGGNTLLES